MGRFLLCGKEAALPYQVEEMDLRLYSAEELIGWSEVDGSDE